VLQKNTATCDEIQWGMQFKKKQVAWLEGLKIHLAPWSPKINLVRRPLGKVPEPLVVRDSDEHFHTG
jgi:hypothetical protein